MLPHKINTRRGWSWPLIFGSAVVLLVGTGLVLIARHDVRAIAAPVGPSVPPPQTASSATSETVLQWSGWDDLGGSFNAGPSVVAWSANRLDVFLRGPGQTLLHRAFNGAKWSPVENLGPSVLGGPGAVARGPDRIDIFVRGADNQLWQKKATIAMTGKPANRRQALTVVNGDPPATARAGQWRRVRARREADASSAGRASSSAAGSSAR